MRVVWEAIGGAVLPVLREADQVSRPEKGTAEWRVMVEAIEVAMAAPMVRGRYSNEAKIPWRTIDALRAALDDAGIDWRTAKSLAKDVK